MSFLPTSLPLWEAYLAHAPQLYANGPLLDSMPRMQQLIDVASSSATAGRGATSEGNHAAAAALLDGATRPPSVLRCDMTELLEQWSTASEP